jgi:hypothetical protein
MKRKKKLKKAERPAPIQVRLPADMLKDLDKKAEQTGLTRHELVVGAVGDSLRVPGVGPDAFAGWDPADALGFLAFGDLAGRLFAHVSLRAGTQIGRKRRLRYALVALMAALDAEGAQPDENYFAAMGRQVGDDEWIRKASKGQRTGLAVIIGLVKGWLASPSTDNGMPDPSRKET